ncbi:hypothetical protein ONS95_007230 [Cadophora gregata]|uniref:uncharacterized protein n=1 Tax=Cadophora gregata TaxID=51156 RepID=UPI0026DC0F49|nr:uncharacterized protein ONS95_007230 [Cadophora gregata]KAK0100781.1 hypothetical protein ONS95_007230 [Cadophora gregata]
MHRNIIVAGATGKQGQALIRALLHPSPEANTASSEHTYHIYALTRNISSPAAKGLVEREQNVTVIEGDLDVPDSIRKVFQKAKQDDVDGQGQGQGIWGVFAVLAFPGLGTEADGEERQGKLLADLALEYGVQCFVYSSAMRSGPKYEDEMKLSSKAKGNVEKYCRVLGEQGLAWTILRPGFFMENFNGFIGSITTSVLRVGLQADTKNGLIATDDIGNVAAAVFRDPEKFRSQTLAVIAEYATISEMDESHRRAKGTSMSAIPRVFGWLLLKLNKATQGLIQDIERSHHARISGEYPECEKELELARSAAKMKSYEEWLVQGRDAEGNSENWNKVSVGKLVTGKL